MEDVPQPLQNVALARLTGDRRSSGKGAAAPRKKPTQGVSAPMRAQSCWSAAQALGFQCRCGQRRPRTAWNNLKGGKHTPAAPGVRWGKQRRLTQPPAPGPAGWRHLFGSAPFSPLLLRRHRAGKKEGRRPSRRASGDPDPGAAGAPQSLSPCPTVPSRDRESPPLQGLERGLPAGKGAQRSRPPNKRRLGACAPPREPRAPPAGGKRWAPGSGEWGVGRGAGGAEEPQPPAASPAPGEASLTSQSLEAAPETRRPGPRFWKPLPSPSRRSRDAVLARLATCFLLQSGRSPLGPAATLGKRQTWSVTGAPARRGEGELAAAARDSRSLTARKRARAEHPREEMPLKNHPQQR